MIIVAGGFILWRSGIFKRAAVAVPEEENIWQDVVTYTDKGFEPAQVTIRKGSAVTFMNRSSMPMRPAADPHPAHTGYPVPGGCVASLLDSCQNIAPGTGWSFRFDAAGTWGYHDHLRPSFKGVVAVK